MTEIIPFPEVMISRDLRMLHPLMRPHVEALMLDLIEHRNPLRIFEAWRSPVRQVDLKADVRKITKAGPWESAHQYGMAVDFALPRGKGWSWSVGRHHWELLHTLAVSHGLLVPSPGWDPGHVEHPAFAALRRVVSGVSVG